MAEHKDGINVGFTKRYNVHDLMYYETYIWIQHAIKREKQIKKWYCSQKDALISKHNPEWKDLSGDI